MEEAVNSISWAHQLAVVEDLADHPFVKQILAGAKRILAHKTTKKEPITPEILHRMYAKLVTPSAELPIICTIDNMSAGLCWILSFQRIGIPEGKRRCFYDEHAEIFVESSKTDQYRDGAWVPIARTDSDICPVTML